MASVFHSLCISATLLATAAPSHAAVSHQLSAQERGFARLLSWSAERTNYQPTYGFSSSSLTHAGAGVWTLAGNHNSAGSGPLNASGVIVVSGGTLTLGTSGFSDSLGALSLAGGTSLITAFPAASSSGSSWSLIEWSGNSSFLSDSSGPPILTIDDWDPGPWANPPSVISANPDSFGSYVIDYSSWSADIPLTLVPEPSTLLLGGLGSLALLRRRRAA